MRKLFGKIFLVIAGLIFALALCEGALRLFNIEYPQFYETDPVIGARLRPGMEGYWLREGNGYVSINQDGLRDREHSIEKPPNTLRIAVLGDSYPEALQVDREEAFWAVMEKELQSCANLRDRKIEVINFGLSGIGTAQELLILRNRAWKYSPDIVLLTFCTGNDLVDNSPRLNHREHAPFFVYQGGHLVLDNSRMESIPEKKSSEGPPTALANFPLWAQDNLRIYQVGQHALQVIREWRPFQDTGSEAQSAPQGEAGLSTAIYREPRREDLKEAWRLTEGIITQMQTEVTARGAKFVVVVLTNAGQVHPDPSERARFARNFQMDDLLYPDRRLKKICQSHGIPVLLLVPRFQDYATRHQVYLHGFRQSLRDTIGTGHWNEKGHRLAGQIIAKWLCPQLK